MIGLRSDDSGVKKYVQVGRVTILLVEDMEEDVFFFRRALSRLGANVDIRVVNNGMEAQTYLEGKAPFHNREYYPVPDLIVCDFKMPRRSGAEFLKWLREQEQFVNLPFVLLSGSVLTHEETLAMKLGANLYLRKTPDFGKTTENAKRILQLIQKKD